MATWKWDEDEFDVTAYKVPSDRVASLASGHAAWIEAGDAPDAKVALDALSYFWAPVPDNAKVIDVAAVLAFVPAPVKSDCTMCRGSGEMECPCCDGKGEIQCQDISCRKGHECGTCNGTGMAPCDSCETPRKSREPRKIVRVMRSYLDARYLAPLRAMRGTVRVWGEGKGEMAPVVFDDGERRLFVMPVSEPPKSEIVVEVSDGA